MWHFEQRETYDDGASIEFKTGYNPNTSSGAFRVQTSNAGRSGSSDEVSLRTGKARQGDSGSVLFETGLSSSGEGGEWNVMFDHKIYCNISYLPVHTRFTKVRLNSGLVSAEMDILVAMSKSMLVRLWDYGRKEEV